MNACHSTRNDYFVNGIDKMRPIVSSKYNHSFWRFVIKKLMKLCLHTQNRIRWPNIDDDNSNKNSWTSFQSVDSLSQIGFVLNVHFACRQQVNSALVRSIFLWFPWKNKQTGERKKKRTNIFFFWIFSEYRIVIQIVSTSSTAGGVNCSESKVQNSSVVPIVSDVGGKNVSTIIIYSRREQK